MASFFTIGEQKVRPGVYYRYENIGATATAGADDGKCAIAFRSSWGEIGKAILLEDIGAIQKTFGNTAEQESVAASDVEFSTGDGNSFDTEDGNGFGFVPDTDSNTLSTVYEAFKGGAQMVYGVRLGSGGTSGTYQIADTQDVPVVQLTLKYPGSRSLYIVVRPTLSDAETSELIILEGTAQLEKLEFKNTENGAQSLIDAYMLHGSSYFTLSKIADSQNPIKTVVQDEITPGTDPVADVAAYSAAFEALETQRWTVLAIDTTDSAIQTMAQAFLDRIYQDGRFVMGVLGDKTSVPFETRLQRASSYNDYKIVYVGNGFIDREGKSYEGYHAAAWVAGMVASTPSNESVTHLEIADAIDLVEPLTNMQYVKAILAGMLTFSSSAAGTFWIDQGINTLVRPGKDDDAGWKKIKRVKVRFELFQRLNDTVDLLVARLNNDQDGRMTVVQVSNNVCNAMVAERKLLTGAHVELDPDNVPQGDSAWFIVYADDIDALEKMYYTFKLRFAPDNEAE
ncbi:phage tail sheath subtilisin-like domain-containing protein [Lachnospiraceae bacterium ZAX-1]